VIDQRILMEAPEPERVTDADIKRLWDKLDQRFTESRNRIEFCRDIQQGRHLIALPPSYDDEAIEEAVIQLPQRKMLALKMVNVLQRKRPTIKRESIGKTQRADDDANDLETSLNALCQELIDWGAMIGRSVHDGEYAIVTQPLPSAWDENPLYLEDEEGEDGKPRPKRDYDRDESGRVPDDEYYKRPERDGKPREFRRDEKRSREAYDEALADFQARRPPMKCRIIAAENCRPIIGTDGKVVGIVIRTLYEPVDLIRKGYKWDKSEQHQQLGWVKSLFSKLLTPTPEGYGAAGSVWMYEIFWLDANNHPYCAYSVGGMATTMWDGAVGTYGSAVIDLYDEYGLTRNPAYYVYGVHTEDVDADEKGMPFLWALAHAMLNVEHALTSANVYQRRVAFPPFGVAPGPDTPKELYMQGNDIRDFEIPSGGGIVVLPGPVQPLIAPRMSDDVKWLVSLLMAAIDESTPAEAIYGGKGAESGRQLVLSREYLEVANGQILDGNREGYEYAASIMAELCSTMARGLWKCLKGRKQRVRIYANVPVKPSGGASAERSTQRAEYEINERWIGNVYDVKALFPKEGANIGEVQQRADLADRGYAPWREVREMLGDENPQHTRSEIAEDEFYKSPEGKAFRLAAALRMRGQLEEAEKLELAAGGQVTPQGAFPSAALAAGLPRPQGAQAPQMPGMGMPNVAASALGGVVQGELGTGPAVAEAQIATTVRGGT
jgi:hypothetical protein